jgi:predicted nuclease of restriction endonuclease-like (RecB) superfamily
MLFVKTQNIKIFSFILLNTKFAIHLMLTMLKNKDYIIWLNDFKTKIRTAQIKAAVQVNSELLLLYWDFGKMINEKLSKAKWGNAVLDQLSKDLMDEFPEMKGFSKANLYFIQRWFLFYNQKIKKVSQVVTQIQTALKMSQVVTQSKVSKKIEGRAGLTPDLILQLLKLVPWGHNREIITKCKDIEEALFYVVETIQNNWSRSALLHQIELNLYKRQGEAINNFKLTLPKLQSDLAKETLKDPYNFDFLTLSKDVFERDIEKGLVEHITKFLLELGAGFAFVGKQYHLEVGGEDFYIDLLFYHLKLRCYVVVELKTTKFKPEYAGKLNFYLSAVDDLLKTKAEKPTIGILICKERNKVMAEYALKDINKPIGISEYKLTEAIPKEFKSSLPSIEELEKELK